MDKQQLYNGDVFKTEEDNGLVFYDFFVALAMHGLVASGETEGVGRRAENIAKDTLDAMLLGHYKGRSDV